MWFKFSVGSERRVTNTPLRERRVSCFVDKQRVSGAFISLYSLPCWLREQRLRKFNSKDFTNDERKIENEMIYHPDYKGK